MNRPVRRVTLTAVSLCVAAFAVAAVAAQPAFGDPPPITGLVSTSHPLAGSWYANPDPVFSWRGVGAASSVTGYSFGLDQDTATIPDTTIDLPPLSFAPRRDISVAVYPTDVAVGDFNRDRKLDLAVLNGNAGSVTIFLGRGNGMFVPRPTFRVGTYSGPIAVGDLNRDGHPDLVVGRQGRAIVLLGHGDGSFAGPHSYSVGTRSDALVIADVNGDRRPDIVSSSGDQVRVLLGRGDGSFGAPRGSVADANGRVGPLAVGDLNGDRRPDVVAGSQEGANLPVGALSVLLGRGTGSFRAAVTHTTDTLLPTGLVVADVNHDGRPDLLVGDYADGVDYGTPSFGAVLVFLGKGDGTFSPGARYDVGQGQLTPKLKLADFNHDGNVDLLVATTAGLSVLLGNGDGAFQAPMQFDSTHRVGGPAVAVGDFNRDGKPDVAVISPESKTVGVFLNRSNAGRLPRHRRRRLVLSHAGGRRRLGGRTHGDASCAYRYPATLDPGPERRHGAEWRRRFPDLRGQRSAPLGRLVHGPRRGQERARHGAVPSRGRSRPQRRPLPDGFPLRPGQGHLPLLRLRYRRGRQHAGQRRLEQADREVRGQ